MVKVLVTCLLFLTLLAYPALPWAAELPVPPSTAPVIQERTMPCSNEVGFQVMVYDTHPGDRDGFIVIYTLVYRNSAEAPRSPFMVQVGVPGQPSAFHLALPGREVVVLTRATLDARYSHPCELVLQIAGSPA